MPDEQYEAAERRVRQKAGLAVHTLAFLTVNAILFSQSGFEPAAGHFWGWGIGLLAHTGFVSASGTRLQQHMIERELQRVQRSKSV
ncbi:2TM domain-containing protein [Egibacter rhizosphaerae]|nr:2TM domain-containing protein [Egibacter rhizosphaerae]